MTQREADRKYMSMAVEAGRRCVPGSTSYCVGAVIVTPVGDVFVGYTHETGPANHAEEEASIKARAAGAELKGATIYSSMEPCSARSSKPCSCSQLIINEGFARAVYALAEPAFFVQCHGDRLMRQAGIRVDVMEEFAPEVMLTNSHVGAP